MQANMWQASADPAGVHQFDDLLECSSFVPSSPGMMETLSRGPLGMEDFEGDLGTIGMNQQREMLQDGRLRGLAALWPL